MAFVEGQIRIAEAARLLGAGLVWAILKEKLKDPRTGVRVGKSTRGGGEDL